MKDLPEDGTDSCFHGSGLLATKSPSGRGVESRSNRLETEVTRGAFRSVQCSGPGFLESRTLAAILPGAASPKALIAFRGIPSPFRVTKSRIDRDGPHGYKRDHAEEEGSQEGAQGPRRGPDPPIALRQLPLHPPTYSSHSH